MKVSKLGIVGTLSIIVSMPSYAVCYDASGSGAEITDMSSLPDDTFVRCFVVPERQYEEFANITLVRSDGLQHSYFDGTAALNPIGASSGETLASGTTNNPPLGDYEWAIVTSSRFTEVKASVDFPVSGSSATCSTSGTAYTPSSPSELIAHSWARHDANDDPVSTSPSSGFPYFYSRPNSSENNIYQRAWVDRYPRPDESNGTAAIALADNFARSSRNWSITSTTSFGLTNELYRSDRANFYKSISSTNSNQMKYRVGIGSSDVITETLSVDPNKLIGFNVTVSVPNSATNGVEFLFQRYNGANYCLGWRRAKQDVLFDFYSIDAD